MRTEYTGPSFSGLIDLQSTNVVYNLPTISVVRSGTVNASGLAAINVVGGFKVVIDTTTLVNGQILLIVATGGVASTISLSNGGTVAGKISYTLNPGNALNVSFDGINLNLQSS